MGPYRCPLPDPLFAREGREGGRGRRYRKGDAGMFGRGVILAAAWLAATPSLAESMNAEAAKRFVAGKLFAFNCFDGSRGAGRIYGDGSVIGTIQFHGSGPVRSIWLPAGTLR